MALASPNVQPYRGKEPYIFISYAHRNAAEVRAILAKMQAGGCRIWYDSGIDPGAEWADHIAERVASCNYFIAFVTSEYLESTNCLDELSFARDKEKKRLLVYLSNVTLPDGISMRANRLQAIHKYAYAREDEFYEKLFQARGIERCMVPPGHGSERAAGSNIQPSRQVLEEKTFTPAAGGPAGQAVKERQTAVLSKPVSRSGRKLLFPAAAVLLFLAVLVFSLVKINGTAGRPAGGSNVTEPAITLDREDLAGLTFGMSQEQVREILTAGSAREKSAYYDTEGLPVVEYVSTGSLYGTQVDNLVSAAAFCGRKIRSLTAGFDSNGLYQVCYRLDAGQDANGKELLKILSSKYGIPTKPYDSCYSWSMRSEVTLQYFPADGAEEDTVLISIPHASYFDMRDFAWGMTPAEAQEAEMAREASLKLTKSDVNSDGYPYQFYEGEWEVHGDPVDLVTLNFVADQLVEMKYILSERSFDQVVADCTALYGKGEDMAGDGSAMAWRIRLIDPDIPSDILIAVSAIRSESGVRLTFRDWERYQSLTGN